MSASVRGGFRAGSFQGRCGHVHGSSPPVILFVFPIAPHPPCFWILVVPLLPYCRFVPVGLDLGLCSRYNLWPDLCPAMICGRNGQWCRVFRYNFSHRFNICLYLLYRESTCRHVYNFHIPLDRCLIVYRYALDVYRTFCMHIPFFLLFTTIFWAPCNNFVN